MFKFNIIKIGALYECKIIGTYQHHNDACEALLYFINKNYKEDKINYKVYNESKDKYSVYEVGYFGKYFNSMYYIIEFDDTNNSYIED